jgi:hypothetical protein
VCESRRRPPAYSEKVRPCHKHLYPAVVARKHWCSCEAKKVSSVIARLPSRDCHRE